MQISMFYSIILFGGLIFILPACFTLPFYGTSKTAPSARWDTTYIHISDDSTFYNNIGGVFNVCNGGSHSISIAPPGTTKPLIDPGQVLLSQPWIFGSTGAVS